MTYLPLTPFAEPNWTDYHVAVDDDGLIVHSECCASRMSREVMIATRDALTAWLDAHAE